MKEKSKENFQAERNPGKPSAVTEDKEGEKIEIKRKRPPFTIVENAIIEDMRISKHGIMQFLVLCKHSDKDGKSCYPSLNTLAKETRSGKSTVISSNKELEKYGYITVERRKDSENPKKNKVNSYTINRQYDYVRKKLKGLKGSPVQDQGSPVQDQGSPDEVQELDPSNKIPINKRPLNNIPKTNNQAFTPPGFLSKSISSPAQEPAPDRVVDSKILKEENPERVSLSPEVTKAIVYSDDPVTDLFLHSIDAASAANLIQEEKKSIKTIAEMLEYRKAYEKKTGRTIGNLSGFIFRGLQDGWEPGDYYRWGYEKAQNGGYEKPENQDDINEPQEPAGQPETVLTEHDISCKRLKDKIKDLDSQIYESRYGRLNATPEEIEHIIAERNTAVRGLDDLIEKVKEPDGDEEHNMKDKVFPGGGVEG